MAPRKRKVEVQAADNAPAVVLEKRVTRAAIKFGQVAVEVVPVKKEVKERKKGGKKEEKEADVVENGKEKEVVAEEGVNGSPVAKGRTVVIEHWKLLLPMFVQQTMQFLQDKGNSGEEWFGKGIPGIAVEINPEKPRRGCFEIRDEGGEKFITLLDMRRPFGHTKALDMEKVIADIINVIKA